MEEISPKTMGAMIYFLEYAVALTGYLLDINPFDQPGVEQGKHYTYGFMGRKGYEEHKQQAEELFQTIIKSSVSL
jgi:glucose-6-phosphate isomerase